MAGNELVANKASASTSASGARRNPLRMRSATRISVGAVQRDDDPEGARDQLQVVPETPGVDVLEVQRQRFIEVERGAAADLPEAGQSGFDGEPAGDGGARRREFMGEPRAGSDDAHLASDHVEQLR